MGSCQGSANRKKHGADSVEVFYDRRALTIPDTYPAEERFVTIGSDVLGCVLVVVYCWRGDRMRIISARRAARLEQQRYEEKR